MLFVDEFSDELTAFVESLLPTGHGHDERERVNGGGPLLVEEWRGELHAKVRTLVDKYGGGGVSRARGPSFVIGDETSSTSASLVQEATADAEVQVNLLPISVASPLPIASKRSSLPSDKTNASKSSSANNAQEEDAKVLAELRAGLLKHRMLEKQCSPEKAVELRRTHLAESHHLALDRLPYEHYDYSEVKDACCENVVGYVPIPTGVAGPLRFVDQEGHDQPQQLVHIPLATTEGALVASVSRGCLCVNESIKALGPAAFFVKVFRDGMSRAPVLEFERVQDACECFEWIQREETFAQLKRSFEETSSYACLKKVEPHLEGNLLYLRFVASTGDAMGMNMVTKGTGRALALVKRHFPQGRLLSISGNFCVDKKPSALNWTQGRGKSVVAEAIVPALVVERVLRTSVDQMVKLGTAKLLVGSSAAVTVGGWNAHAANIVAAMFLATGQDAAQVVSSSMCLTQLNRRPGDGALHISCTMNCLEVGTVGGGTVLTPQSACLEMLGCRQSGLRPGQNAERFARLVCATVLAGELSLLASQCNEGELERTHLKYNRSYRTLALSSSAYPLMSCTPNSPSRSALQLLGSPGACKKSSSMAAIPPPIPEHQIVGPPTTTTAIEPNRGVPHLLGEEDKERGKKTRSSTATSTETPREQQRSRTQTLSQTGVKLMKKAGSGHMPCKYL